MAELTFQAFDLADKYRNPVMLLGDGLMGQMMEPVVFPDPIDPDKLPPKDWILDGCKGRKPRQVFSMLLDTSKLFNHNLHLQEKYESILADEVRFDTHLVEDAEVVVVAYGTASRIAKGAVNRLRREGHKVGLFRPISLYPYPKAALRQVAQKGVKIAVFELSMGQMVEDVIISAGSLSEIYSHGIPGGPIPTPADVGEFVLSVLKGDGRVGRRVEV